MMDKVQKQNSFRNGILESESDKEETGTNSGLTIHNLNLVHL
jgi:hypothetical protein